MDRSAAEQVARVRINRPGAILDLDLARRIGLGRPDRGLAVRAEPVVVHAVGEHDPDDDRVAERRTARHAHLGGRGAARSGNAFLSRIPDRAAGQSNRDDDASRQIPTHGSKTSTRRSVSPYSQGALLELFLKRRLRYEQTR